MVILQLHKGIIRVETDILLDILLFVDKETKN